MIRCAHCKLGFRAGDKICAGDGVIGTDSDGQVIPSDAPILVYHHPTCCQLKQPSNETCDGGRREA